MTPGSPTTLSLLYGPASSRAAAWRSSRTQCITRCNEDVSAWVSVPAHARGSFAKGSGWAAPAHTVAGMRASISIPPNSMQGTAHSLVERERLGLRGLLPPSVLPVQRQVSTWCWCVHPQEVSEGCCVSLPAAVLLPTACQPWVSSAGAPATACTSSSSPFHPRLQLSRTMDRYWHGSDFIDPSQVCS